MNTIQAPDFLAIAQTLKNDVRRYAKVYCLQWFDDSFQNQGFTDSVFKPWQKRLSSEERPDRRAGGAILVDTTFLRRSIDVMEENGDTMKFGTPVPYASLHNNGGRLRVIQNVRGFHRTRKGVREQVKPFFRKMDAKYPQRQFIGHSQKMMEGLDTWLINEIQKRFNQ